MAATKGEAYATTGNITGDRFFKLSTDNTNTGPTNRTWELSAGASITLYFRTWTTGTLPPALPDGDGTDQVRLSVYYETGTGTLVRELYSAGTPPTSGTSYTFHATTTGLSGGSPRAGTLRLRMEIDQTNELLDNYSLDTDADTATQVPGALRCNMRVTDLTHGGYPSGATYAYGVSGDEVITLTATHSQRFADRNVEKVIFAALDSTTVQASDNGQEIGTTSTSSTFIANDTFDDASKTYGALLVVNGNSLLMPSELWTHLVADGANVSQNGVDAVRRLSFYNVDPRITINNVSLSKNLHRRGDATTIDFNVRNARSENLTRSINYQLKNSLGTVRSTGNDSGANYDINYTIGSSDDASFDFTGKQWTFNTNQGDVDSNPSSNAYRVSRKLRKGSAVGLNDLAIATDQEVYNNTGTDPVAISYYLSNPDGTALASTSGINSRVHDDTTPTSNEEDVSVVATDASGRISYSYTPASGDKTVHDATGSLKHVEVDYAGNTTDDSLAEWGVSSKLLIPNYSSPTSAGDLWTGKTDLDGDANGDPDGTDETSFFVGADVLYSKARIQNIRGENLDNVPITAWLLRNAVVAQGPQTGAVSQTESGYLGWQDLFYQFDVKAPAGARVLRVEGALGGSTTGNASKGGYLTKDLSYAPSYTGNLFLEVNYEPHDLVKDELRFTVTPVIFSTANNRQLLSEVSPVPTVDIDPRYHITRYDSAGAPVEVGVQTTMTRILGGDDDQWEATITGLTSLKGKTAHVHIVMTLNGGQVQASFPVIVGSLKNKKVLTKFNPALGSVQS